LTITVSGSKAPENIVFYSPDQKTVRTFAVDFSTGNVASIAVPAEADHFVMSYKGVASDEVALDSATAPRVSVESSSAYFGTVKDRR
jgi:hypothetical protein